MLKNRMLSFCGLVLLIVGCVSTEVEVNGSLIGRVVDRDTQEAVEGCEITIEGQTMSVKTASDGRYEFPLIEMGRKNIVFKKNGYQSAHSTILVVSGKQTILDMALLSISVPMVETLMVENIETKGAILGGLIVTNGGSPITECGFYYGTTSNMEHKCVLKDFGNRMSYTLSGLQAGTKYYYAAYAKNEMGEARGEVEIFTTESINSAVVETYSAAEILDTQATLNGKILDYGKGTLISCGFYYGSDPEKLDRCSILSSDGTLLTLTLSSLQEGTKYYYKAYAENESGESYGNLVDFTTLVSVTDLSSSASANCYIVSKSGTYKFKAVKGNSTTSVGSVASASILWETFGSSTAPEMLDLISAPFCYKNGYIAFKTSDTFKEGNAVIAAKDAAGNILWSWHIWFTDLPQAQVYYNNAGTMMDRNLGATSATPGDVGALGLLYQWGRKDPFLGSSSISDDVIAKSTITWPSAVELNSSNGTIEYAIANPTTFISSSYGDDWCYTGSSSTDNTRWTTTDKAKSIYDPCPAGWRVPDGGEDGVWSKALGSSSDFTHSYSRSKEGMNFSGKFGSASPIWYPASGFRGTYAGSLGCVGYSGLYWSASPDSRSSDRAYHLYIDYFDVYPLINGSRATGGSVRCLQE